MLLCANDELRDQLLTHGVLPAEDLERHVREAAEQGDDLEDLLRKKRVLTDGNLIALKALRNGVSYCNLSDFLPSLQNAELLPEDLVRRHVMFPIFVFDDVITLVVADPNDLTGIDQVRRQTRKEVDVCLAGRGDILGLIERAYGASNYLKEFAESSADEETTLEQSDKDESRPVIRLVNELIAEAVRQNASDIHVEPGEQELRIRIRVDGVLREVAAPPLGMHRAIVSRIKVIARLDISQTRAPQDGAFHHQVGDKDAVIRVSVLPSIFGEAVVLRILRNESEAIALHDIGMAPATLERFQQTVSNSHGMVLVSGPTGSGKSTTLYAAMRYMASPTRNIIAIEDPVEYRTSLIRQVQVNPEAHLTFASGLRSMLRQDPDVIMVGEIRDSETAHIAVQASLTGHLVLSTVHTNDSIGAVARFRELGVAEYLISSSLLGVLAQRLCRRICPDCVQPDDPPEVLLRVLGLDPAQLDFEPMRGRGCRRCVGSGYIGRTGLYEFFEVNEEYSRLIAEKQSTEEIRASARANCMRFLVDDGVEKVRQGVTTVAEVARMAARN